MHRRRFLQAGFAAGLAGLAAGRNLSLGYAADSERALRLNSNENPRGLSVSAREAVLQGLDEAGRYPFAQMELLIEALAKRHQISAANLVLGNGSSEIIQMAVQALTRPGMKIVMAAPTFESPADYAAPDGVEVEKIPLADDFSHDLTRMREAAEAASEGALVYLCNPNNPTGTLTPHAEIESWFAAAGPKTWFLIDEAYHEYLQPERRWSALPWISKSPQLTVTRTFSKVFGMAGMRLGYGMAHEDTIVKLTKFASDANVNHLALVAAQSLLKDPAFEAESVRLNQEGKRLLCNCLDELEIDYIPSRTNFVMHSIRGELQQHIQRMKEAGALVGRPFPPLLGYNRVSIGLPGEMERFVAILKSFRSKGWI